MPVNHLSVEKLSKSFNEKVLFENLTFGLEQGQKVALVGINGCGKSTLLKILAGLEAQDDGIVSFQKDLSVQYLHQSPNFGNSVTVGEAIFDANQKEAMVLKRYYQLVNKQNSTEHEKDELQNLLGQIESLNAWDYEFRVKEVLGKLGVHDLEAGIESLSGGQQKRVALAAVLVHRPDFLILDEPTNHLDLDIIEWLENYLSTQTLTLIMVTHDRYFLDKVTSDIIELESGELYQYHGNYSHYLEKKAEREEIAQKTKDKARNLMRKELDWMRRQPKARGTKAKYRIDAFHDLKEKASINLSKQEVEIKTGESRMGKKVLETKNLSKAYSGTTIFEGFDYTFTKGEKVGIIGKNGTGKSTFLNVLSEIIKPDSGSIDKGINTKIGYYTQVDLVFNNQDKVIDVVRETAESITLADGSTVTASQFLNLFLFPPAKQHDHISKLSGGEKRRLQLLQVLIANPNFLILDEPTNDLDIITLNVLEDYLENFTGCLMIVSHDRYFMDRLVDHLFIFDEYPAIKDFPGNYTDYRLVDTEKSKPVEKPKSEKKEKPRLVTKQKLSFKEQREFESLEKELPDLETLKADLTASLNSGITDHVELASLAKKLEEVTISLDEKELRWLELSERV